MTTPDIAKAVQFLAANARVLDRRRYERLFEQGGAQPVRDAVAAYLNPDGGFGQALEPDGRAPASQPAAVELALRILHETDVWDGDLAAGACAWLEATAPAGGGAAFVDPGLDNWPHAPWWVPEEGRPASLIMTGLIAGTLHARSVRHPWLDRATGVMWSRIAQISEPTGYGMLGVLRFLQYVPDRDRALAVFGQIARLTDSGIVTLDPDAPGEVHSPLDFAPRPDSLGQDFLGLGVRSVGDDSDAMVQLDAPGVHGRGQAARLDQFPGLGQFLAELLHERPHGGEILRRPGWPGRVGRPPARRSPAANRTPGSCTSRVSPLSHGHRGGASHPGRRIRFPGSDIGPAINPENSAAGCEPRSAGPGARGQPARQP